MKTNEILSESAEDILRMVEEHRRLLVQAMEGGDSTEDLPQCVMPRCPHRRLLKETLVETIEILEDTRRAFKSRQLEQLRKRLMQILAEQA